MDEAARGVFRSTPQTTIRPVLGSIVAVIAEPRGFGTPGDVFAACAMKLPLKETRYIGWIVSTVDWLVSFDRSMAGHLRWHTSDTA